MAVLVVVLLIAVAVAAVMLVVLQGVQHVQRDVGYTADAFLGDREAWMAAGSLPPRVTRVYIGKDVRTADAQAMTGLGYRLAEEHPVQWPRSAKLWVDTWVRS